MSRSLRPLSIRELYDKISPIRELAFRTYWGIDEEDLYEYIPGLTWQYNSKFSQIPIYASLMPIHPYAYIVLRNIQLVPTSTSTEADAIIRKMSYVGHLHDIVRLYANPTISTYGGLDRVGWVLERPIVVPLWGCNADPQFQDGIHIQVLNGYIHFSFAIFNLLMNIARRDFVAEDVVWDFVDPQGNVYQTEPCDEIWTNYAEWSGTGTSEITVWAGMVSPPVRAHTVGVLLTCSQAASVTGSYVKVQVSLDGSTWTDIFSVSPIPTSLTEYRVRANKIKMKWIRVVVNPNSTTDQVTIRLYNVLVWV